MSEQHNQIKKVVTQLTSVLNPRNREIIARRFGLKTGTKETLESIGTSYGITRERVRQIEEVSLAQIRESLGSDAGQGAQVKPFVSLVHNILESNGGVIHEEELFARFSGVGQETPTNAALVFILTLARQFDRSLEDESFHTFWSSNKDRTGQFRSQTAQFVSSLEKQKHAMPESQIADAALASYLAI